LIRESNRLLAAATFFSLLAATAVGQKAPGPSIAQIPDGTVSTTAYANPTLGVTWDIPSGWSANIDPKNSDALDPDHPNGRARQCSKVLVWVTAPRDSEEMFASMAAVIAIDPHCLSHAEFPQSTFEKDKTNDVIDAILKNFKHSPFFSPYGVKIVAFPLSGGRSGVKISMTGGMTINAVSGHPAATRMPLGVNTFFSVMEHRGYWLAVAYVADGPSTAELKKAGPVITDAPSQ
jgi:hypothetical protein